MANRLMNIRSQDRGWHEAFLRYVPRTFPSASFRRWYELRGWDESYQAFAIVEGEEIVASASLQRMDLVIDGQPTRGWQLGAVGTLPQWRGRGLQREILPRVLQAAGADDLVFLFANDSVTDFYPRFGFKPVTESVFRASHEISPSQARSRQLRVDSEQDRALLARLAAHSKPVTERFGAQAYGGVLLWYWTNFHGDSFHYLEREDAILVAEQEHDVLRIFDVIAVGLVDLRGCLPRIASGAVRQIEFGFTPERWWLEARPVHEYRDSPLFVRGSQPLLQQLPQSPFKYPMMAQT